MQGYVNHIGKDNQIALMFCIDGDFEIPLGDPG